MAKLPKSLHDSLRTSDGLNEVVIVTGDSKSIAKATEIVREHWSTLRDEGLAEAQPVKIFVAEGDRPTVTYCFRWRNAQARSKGREKGRSASLIKDIRALAQVEILSPAHEAYQGFEYRRFPTRGGNELLRGKCTCKLALDSFFPKGRPPSTEIRSGGDPMERYEKFEGIEVDGENGFVLMHRGPAFEIEAVRLMPVTILAHGADNPNPLATVANVPDHVRALDFKVRVEQNTDLPQFGIIRAQSNKSDFPATAMWVVHWRIHTPLGTIITDPDVPLVFGPTTVLHYPPVGTKFASSTGPVRVLDADTGKPVGTLAPGELTAFDIVVTMDDIVPSLMDVPAKYHVDLFNRHAPKAQRISATGLVDDFRVPPSLRGRKG